MAKDLAIPDPDTTGTPISQIAIHFRKHADKTVIQNIWVNAVPPEQIYTGQRQAFTDYTFPSNISLEIIRKKLAPVIQIQKARFTNHPTSPSLFGFAKISIHTYRGIQLQKSPRTKVFDKPWFTGKSTNCPKTTSKFQKFLEQMLPKRTAFKTIPCTWESYGCRIQYQCLDDGDKTYFVTKVTKPTGESESHFFKHGHSNRFPKWIERFTNSHQAALLQLECNKFPHNTKRFTLRNHAYTTKDGNHKEILFWIDSEKDKIIHFQKVSQKTKKAIQNYYYLPSTMRILRLEREKIIQAIQSDPLKIAQAYQNPDLSLQTTIKRLLVKKDKTTYEKLIEPKMNLNSGNDLRYFKNLSPIEDYTEPEAQIYGNTRSNTFSNYTTIDWPSGNASF